MICMVDEAQQVFHDYPKWDYKLSAADGWLLFPLFSPSLSLSCFLSLSLLLEL